MPSLAPFALKGEDGRNLQYFAELIRIPGAYASRSRTLSCLRGCEQASHDLVLGSSPLLVDLLQKKQSDLDLACESLRASKKIYVGANDQEILGSVKFQRATTAVLDVKIKSFMVGRALHDFNG